MPLFKMLIGAKAPVATNTFDVINPATEQPFATCQLGDSSHVDQAVNSAKEAFQAWSLTTSDEKNKYLLDLADALEAHMPELMTLVSQENGKPLNGFKGIGSGMEVGGAIAWIRYTTSLELKSEIIQDNDEARVELHRKPLGVVASITPWNWPLLIAIWHVIPALKAGNTVIIKPSPLTPLSTIRMVEIANTILPPGVLNVVTGDTEVGAAISAHQDINKIVFTGSTPTGKNIMKSASCNLKRLTLELGGNDAGIVLPNSNISEIAENLFSVSFHNNGQTCAALKRLYVHESQYDELCIALTNIANSITVGNGLEESTDLGPLQNKAQLNIVKDLADDSRKSGGKFLCGGEEPNGNGYFYKPTIVAGLTNGHRLVDEEQFGPILPVVKYSSIEEAISLANDNENGLGGSIWGQDIELATKLSSQLECGTVWINDHGSVQPNAPFGGVKQSGIGVEFGQHGLDEYTSIQTIKILKITA